MYATIKLKLGGAKRVEPFRFYKAATQWPILFICAESNKTLTLYSNGVGVLTTTVRNAAGYRRFERFKVQVSPEKMNKILHLRNK